MATLVDGKFPRASQCDGMKFTRSGNGRRTATILVTTLAPERVSLREAALKLMPGASITNSSARIARIATTFIKVILGTVPGQLSIDIGSRARHRSRIQA